MGELAASIAHEVNQPLGAIVGNADICLQWLGDTDPDLAQLREAIEDIASDGRRASEVIARIRSLVKKGTAEKAPLDMSEVAREVLDLVRHEANRRQLALRSELEDGLIVKGDRVQLQQVLLNLVMKGFEAMTDLKERRPELTVQLWRSKSGEIHTAVRDCGAGIKPEHAEQVFKAFHTTKAAGMGMGLAISRSIVEAHGGRWASQLRARGMFTFTLPLVGGRVMTDQCRSSLLMTTSFCTFSIGPSHDRSGIPFASAEDFLKARLPDVLPRLVLGADAGFEV
jgi:C4-dicarboxylate-specific signal transduction histidine kinase